MDIKIYGFTCNEPLFSEYMWQPEFITYQGITGCSDFQSCRYSWGNTKFQIVMAKGEKCNSDDLRLTYIFSHETLLIITILIAIIRQKLWVSNSSVRYDFSLCLSEKAWKSFLETGCNFKNLKVKYKVTGCLRSNFVYPFYKFNNQIVANKQIRIIQNIKLFRLIY